MWRWRLYVFLGLVKWFDRGIRTRIFCYDKVYHIMAYIHIAFWGLLAIAAILLAWMENWI